MRPLRVRRACSVVGSFIAWRFAAVSRYALTPRGVPRPRQLTPSPHARVAYAAKRTHAVYRAKRLLPQRRSRLSARESMPSSRGLWYVRSVDMPTFCRALKSCRKPHQMAKKQPRADSTARQAGAVEAQARLRRDYACCRCGLSTRLVQRPAQQPADAPAYEEKRTLPLQARCRCAAQRGTPKNE